MLKEERASPKCDVYSYAIVLWELVSFQVPFQGLARFPIMLKVTNGEVNNFKTTQIDCLLLMMMKLSYIMFCIPASCYSKWL